MTAVAGGVEERPESGRREPPGSQLEHAPPESGRPGNGPSEHEPSDHEPPDHEPPEHEPPEHEPPVSDPTRSLPEPAQELLEAAKSLLLRGGFEALRLDAIVREAGKNKASVKYYFGNKEGLVGAIMDSLDHDQCLQLAERTRDVAGKERLERYIAGQTEMAADDDAFLMFFDILPRVARDGRLRERAGALYDWYYQMNLEWLGLTRRVTPENQEELVALASFLVAVVDGLAVQAALRPQGFDLAKAMRVLGFFLERSLEEYVTTAAAGHEAAGSAAGR